MASRVTCTAPVNIATIKYWGKRDEKLLLPTNSSLSGTLDQVDLNAKTSIAASPAFTADRIWLNGVEESIENERLQNCLREVRRLASARGGVSAETAKLHVHIASVNNFPTAAGLASSAAGYACLVFALGNLHGLGSERAALSAIARQGSGSACRSLYGGFVKWNRGQLEDGLDSIAEQVADECHWPDMDILILVANDQKKTTSSTDGMQTTVETSPLLKYRAEHVVEPRLKQMEDAIQARDFQTFGTLTMQDSNQFHAVCLDTYPPIFYLSDVSRAVINIVTHLNAQAGRVVVAYTFDAGPNAVIYAPRENMAAMVALTHHFFPSSVPDFYRGTNRLDAFGVASADVIKRVKVSPIPGGLKYLLHTKIGPGPQVLDDSASLLNADGLPVNVV